jgi:pyruvate dehydrogenase E2 component (dihydrolipoamide acetyltransferase)
MELEAYEDGTLLYIGVEDGGSVEIDGVIAVIGEEGADYEKLLQAHNAKKQGGDQQDEAPVAQDSVTAEDKSKETAGHKGAAEVTPTHAETPAASATNTEGGRVKASPLAKKMAKEMGYDISQIPGTGENGRVVRRDVENYKPAPKPAAEQPAAARQDTARQPAPVSLPEVVGEEQYEEVRVSQMRKTIARRLSESKFTAPHFYLTMEINMDNAIRARKSMNELSPVKISFNDIVLKAAAAALRLHPQVNVSWLGDKMRYNKHIHIGVAVAVEEGLLVPVVRFADNKTISHISAEVKDLATKAKNKQLQPQDWEGSTFTISNLGMFGIEEFTAIVNPPDACIMAVGGIKETPVVKDGQIVPGNVMKVTMSCDHRAVDGAIGAAFLKTFKQFMEDPIRILI